MFFAAALGVLSLPLFDGFARELINRPERLVVSVPEGVSHEQAACAPIGFGTVQHMLFDNARLEPGESILVHAGGSGSDRPVSESLRRNPRAAAGSRVASSATQSASAS